MRQLEEQSFLKRYVRQDANRSYIEQFNKSLDDAIRLFDASFLSSRCCTFNKLTFTLIQMNLQMSVVRLQIETLEVSHMSKKEREVRAVHL